MYVTKFDGRKQFFDKQKIVKTCLRMGANYQQANDVADRIEKGAYDGIRTKEIIKKVFIYLQKYKPEIKHQIDLRESIALMRPKPDFEQFVSLLLAAYGYKIKTNQIIDGKCVDHEIDVVAEKGNEVILVEVKHHFQPHTFTGLPVFLEVQAKFEDFVEGYKVGRNKINFNKVLVVGNTKISDHAKRYSTCKGIQNIGWRYPEKKGLEKMIEEKGLYPITFLKGLDVRIQAKLGDNGIILLKQLVEMNINELVKKTGIKKEKIFNLVKRARELLL